MESSGTASPSLSDSGSPRFLGLLDCPAWIRTLAGLAQAPCTWHGSVHALPGLCLGLGSCWPLCLLGLQHLWPVLKLSSLLTFRRPPSTSGLPLHTARQPAVSLIPRQRYPKSAPTGSCVLAAPTLGPARQSPPLGPSAHIREFTASSLSLLMKFLAAC